MDQNKKLKSGQVLFGFYLGWFFFISFDLLIFQRPSDIYCKFCGVFCLIVSNETANTHFTFRKT